MGLLWGIPLHSAWAAGETVSINGSDVLSLPEWSVRDVASGGKLLLSDSPEEFTQTGILYSDVVEGDVRLFFHHVNGMLYDKKVAVVLENIQDKPVKMTVYRAGVAGPHFDYLLVGKTVQQNYFASKGPSIIEIPAKGAVLLDEKAANNRIKPKQLVNGIYDFIANGQVRVKVMAVGAFADPLREHRKATVLPADVQHLRGTFPFANRLKLADKVYDAANDGQQVVTLGDGVTDKFITGIDATDGSAVLNYGNYGVFYQIFLPSTPASPDFNLTLNPRGGVYAGALELKIDTKLKLAVGTPGDRIFLESPDTAVNVGTVKSDATLWVNFMPPGASNLPVKMILTPEK
jgi:hypothetical protein